VTWEQREARIDDANGNTVFQQKDVRVPASWSQTALNIVASKYLDGKVGTEGREKGVDALIARGIATIRESSQHQGYFSSPEAAETFEAELAG
jgi:ribonucleoside-diphosphate reductase alpha chain